MLFAFIVEFFFNVYLIYQRSSYITNTVLIGYYEDMKGWKLCQIRQVSPNFMVCICIYEAVLL